MQTMLKMQLHCVYLNQFNPTCCAMESLFFFVVLRFLFKPPGPGLVIFRTFAVALKYAFEFTTNETGCI